MRWSIEKQGYNNENNYNLDGSEVAIQWTPSTFYSFLVGLSTMMNIKHAFFELRIGSGI